MVKNFYFLEGKLGVFPCFESDDSLKWQIIARISVNRAISRVEPNGLGSMILPIFDCDSIRTFLASERVLSHATGGPLTLVPGVEWVRW